MSSISTLQEFDFTIANSNHNQGLDTMKSEHFIYKKAPKNSRLSNTNHKEHNKGQDKFMDLSEDTLTYDLDYDLTHPEFSVGELNPSKIKRFQNLEAYPYAFEKDQDVLSWLTAMMSESPFGNSLLQHFESENWLICISELENGGYYLDIEQKTLEIDNFGLDCHTIGRSNLFRNSILVNFARALRDIWHETKQYEHEKQYSVDMAMLLERTRIADIDAVAVFIAWELRSAGYKEVWRHIIGSEEGDMAQVLLNISDAHPTSIYNGMALAHIFRQWYADPVRVDAVDHMFLEELDHKSDQEKLELGAKVPSPLVIEQMAKLVDGASYLKDIGETVLRDPFFCKLEDPINEAHLFQIIYDSKVTMREGVPFRDGALARKIFPN